MTKTVFVNGIKFFDNPNSRFVSRVDSPEFERFTFRMISSDVPFDDSAATTAARSFYGTEARAERGHWVDYYGNRFYS